MEASTALQCPAHEAPVGSCILGSVRDYFGRLQGTALFVVCGTPSTEGALVTLPVQFGGSSDSYYRWWGQTESGPPAGGARMEILVCSTDYVDPDRNKVVLKGALVLDTERLCSSKAGERLGGWDAMAMKCAKTRLKAILGLLPKSGDTGAVPPDAGIPALQQALGGGMPDAPPEEMLTREELIEQLAAARQKSSRGHQHEEEHKRVDRQGSSKLGEVLMSRVVSIEAGASLGERVKRPAAHSLLKALGRKATDSESDDDEVESGRPQKVARSSPGKLAHSYLKEMHRQSHVSLGLGPKDETEFPRVASFFLTTVLTRRLPNLTQNMRSWREAQTLAGILDCLSAGEVCQAMDIVTQRMKALELAASQGHWQQARWLELLGTDTAGALQPSEVRVAQRREKLDRALGNPLGSGASGSASVPPQAQVVPPPAPTVPGAGANRESEKGKGKSKKGKGRK
eukprot:5575480-Amphidinium_carterae.2